MQKWNLAHKISNIKAKNISPTFYISFSTIKIKLEVFIN